MYVGLLAYHSVMVPGLPRQLKVTALCRLVSSLYTSQLHCHLEPGSLQRLD